MVLAIETQINFAESPTKSLFNTDFRNLFMNSHCICVPGVARNYVRAKYRKKTLIILFRLKQSGRKNLGTLKFSGYNSIPRDPHSYRISSGASSWAPHFVHTTDYDARILCRCLEFSSSVILYFLFYWYVKLRLGFSNCFQDSRLRSSNFTAFLN